MDKLKYLRSYLSGKAEGVISGLATTNESYNTAIDLLKERFCHKSLIVNDHMRRLLNLCKVRSCEDFEGLQSLYEKVQTRVRSLCNLGVEEKEYGVLLKTAIIQNLPQEMVLRYTRRTLSSTNTSGTSDQLDELSILLDFLSLEVRSRVQALLLTDDHREQVLTGKPRSNDHNQGSASMLAMNLDPESCMLCCAKDNSLDDCPAELTLDEK